MIIIIIILIIIIIIIIKLFLRVVFNISLKLTHGPRKIKMIKKNYDS